jgi:segregation and condensation protein B
MNDMDKDINLQENDMNEIDASKDISDLSEQGTADPVGDDNLVVEYKEYSQEYLMSAIEAVLFSVGESVSLGRLAQALEMEPKKLSKQMEQIIEAYNSADRGIRMVELEDSYQLCTRNEYYDVLTKVVSTPKKPNLTDVVLETLSIVAYKQPITRPEIEAIRGVSCVHAINKLIEYNLIDEVGRLDAPGRPILFGTTEEFLRCFGVASVEDLPLISPDKIEDFKKEAQEEANEITLGLEVPEE